MIGNLLNILVGLWLAYSAIFANPAGAMNNPALAAAAVSVSVFAVWARQTDAVGWQSGMNIVLVGIAVAVAAMWSMLYRPTTARSAASSYDGVRTNAPFAL